MSSQHTLANGRKAQKGEQYTRVEKTTKPSPSSKKTRARAVHSHDTSHIDATAPKRNTRSSKKDSQAQALGSQSTLAANSIPLEPVQQPPTAPKSPPKSSQSIGPKRRRKVEEDYPTKRQRKDSQPTVESTQPFHRLNEKNLEELDRQTESGPLDGMGRAATSSGKGGKKRHLSLQSSSVDMDQVSASTTTQKSSTLATYRWMNLSYARILVEDGPLPENIRDQVNTIILPKSSDARKIELSLITETFCDDFVDVVKGALREDDFVEPIAQALKSMDKDKKFMLSRKNDWDPSLKPDVQWDTWHLNTLDQPNGTADDSLNHPTKRQQAEPAYVSPNSLEQTMAPPLPPFKPDMSVVKTPRPDITVAPKLSNLVELLKARGLREGEPEDFLKILQYQQAFRFNPFQPIVPICFPPMVVEGKSYSTGKTVFEAQNQAAVSGAYMTDMQHNVAKFTQSTCHGSHQIKEPLAFSICTEGPMVQLWVHYTKMKGDVRQYHMNIIKICHASSFESLREGVRDFFVAVDGIMDWATSDLLAEIADQLVLVWKVTRRIKS